MTKNDLLDLNNLKECEIIRHSLKNDELRLLVVGDNEEGEIVDHHDDEEACDCCDGLNGHLFELVFSGVKNFNIEGEECDNYKTKRIECSNSTLSLKLEGINFIEENHEVKISFQFVSYQVIDKGEIVGPDA